MRWLVSGYKVGLFVIGMRLEVWDTQLCTWSSGYSVCLQWQLFHSELAKNIGVLGGCLLRKVILSYTLDWHLLSGTSHNKLIIKLSVFLRSMSSSRLSMWGEAVRGPDFTASHTMSKGPNFVPGDWRRKSWGPELLVMYPQVLCRLNQVTGHYYGIQKARWLVFVVENGTQLMLYLWVNKHCESSSVYDISKPG